MSNSQEQLKAMGEVLKAHARTNGLTNKSVQSNTGMAVNTIKAVFEGESGNIKSILTIADIFKLSLFDLVDEAKMYLSQNTTTAKPAVASTVATPAPAKVEQPTPVVTSAAPTESVI